MLSSGKGDADEPLEAEEEYRKPFMEGLREVLGKGAPSMILLLVLVNEITTYVVMAHSLSLSELAKTSPAFCYGVN